MLNLLHKKCKLGGYVRGQMPKDANVICEGSLISSWVGILKQKIAFCTDQTQNYSKLTYLYCDFFEAHLLELFVKCWNFRVHDQHFQTQSPSQSAPTILVLKTRVGLWPWKKNQAPCILKKQGAKNQGHCYSKKEEAAWSLLFLNNNDPVLLYPAFCKKQGSRFFKSSRP